MSEEEYLITAVLIVSNITMYHAGWMNGFVKGKKSSQKGYKP